MTFLFKKISIFINALFPFFEFATKNWNQAVYEICQKYRRDIPELKPIFFDEGRPPNIPPLSSQVHELTSILVMGGLMYWIDINYKIMRMERGNKRRVIKNNERRLGKYRSQIADMAKILEEHLKI